MLSMSMRMRALTSDKLSMHPSVVMLQAPLSNSLGGANLVHSDGAIVQNRQGVSFLAHVFPSYSISCTAFPGEGRQYNSCCNGHNSADDDDIVHEL